MKAWQHFKTITSHRFKVMKYCFRAGMFFQGLTHDLSKYSISEFIEGIKYFQGGKSPNSEAKAANGISYAWLHHKGRNKHHFEYWIDYDPNSEFFLSGLDMPKKYIAEMLIDRICACQVYNARSYSKRSALEYYNISKDRLWFISDKTKQDLEMLLNMVADKGEDYTLRYIKNIYLKK